MRVTINNWQERRFSVRFSMLAMARKTRDAEVFETWPQVTFRKRGQLPKFAALRTSPITPFCAGFVRIVTNGVKAMSVGRLVKEFIQDLSVNCAS